jgi:hypothetical protein
MAKAKGKKKQGGQPPGQSNTQTAANQVQLETKPPGRPTSQSTQREVGQADPNDTDPDVPSLVDVPADPPLQESSNSSNRTPLDPTAPPYVPRSNQMSSPTPSNSLCPRVIEVETVTSTSVRSGRMSPHRIDDDGAASRQGSQSMRTESSFQ